MSVSPRDVLLKSPAYDGLLGRGKFEVYKCRKKDGTIQAVKVLNHGGSRNEIDKVKRSLRSEFEILMKTKRSPHIVNIVGIVEYQYWSGIVMEYSPRGNLCDLLKEYNPSFWLRLRTASYIADGITFLHNEISSYEAISHNDLKPQNIVIDENFQPKICDFDGSDIIARTSGLVPFKEWRDIASYTENYAAPELLKIIEQEGKRIKRERSMDVFSFAMIIYFILTGNHPFGDLESGLVMKRFIEGDRPKMPEKPSFLDEYPDEYLKGLIQQMETCWKQNPKERSKIKAVAQNFSRMLSQEHRQLINEQIKSLKEQHPLCEDDDSSKYGHSFETFCEEQRHPCSYERTETALPEAMLEATAGSAAALNTITVDNLAIRPKEGDSIQIKSRNIIVSCRVEQVHARQ